jgi:hypothetical protein
MKKFCINVLILLFSLSAIAQEEEMYVPLEISYFPAII